MSEALYCANHPKVETYIRCNRCSKPICPKCAVRTPVGYRCRECISSQQQVFYAASRPIDNVIAAAVALVAGAVAGWLVPSLGWFALVLGPAAGLGIAELAFWAVGRRRSRYLWLPVCGAIVLSGLPFLIVATLGLVLASAFDGVPGAVGGLWSVAWSTVYMVTAALAAYRRLKAGR